MIRSASRVTSVAAVLAVALAGAAAIADPTTAEKRLARAGAEMDLGKRVYERYCVGCHGASGDGKGEAARFLEPKPRDFTLGKFKFGSVVSGNLPRDEDLMKTIERGLRGTSMPSFRFVPLEERRAVVRYLKTFAAERWQTNLPGAPVPRTVDPYDASLDDAKPLAEAIAEGRRIYHQIGCSDCHPSYMTADDYAKATGKALRPEAERPILTEDSWGQWIAPPDFARQALKASWTVDEIQQTVTAGIGGTAMPTMLSIPDEQRWQLAHFLKSLQESRGAAQRPAPRPRDPRTKPGS
jgi:cytochrome c oxidase cbb3-type subunit I/II